MASVEQVAAAIRAALAEVVDADRLIGAVAERYEQAIGLLVPVTDGTGSADVSTALAALADARQRLDDARAAVAAATREVEQYLGDIGAGGNRDDRVPEAVASSPTTPAPPTRVVQLAGRLPPRAPGGKTTAVLIGPNGAVQVASGRNRDTTSDLHARFRPISVDHAEGRAARVMRRDHLTRADLVVNAEPCGYPTVGCRDALPKMLPRGTTLTVWVTDPGGTVRYFGTCTGTGEGIKP